MRSIAAVVLFCLLAVTLFAIPQVASQSNAGCSVAISGASVYQDGVAKFGPLGAYDSLAITYTNVLDCTLTGFVFAVVHNYSGQTVTISTATLQLASGANGTEYPIVFGLPPASYLANLFVVSTAGTALSASTVVNFTIGE
jgi:hypothetical protein